jgi:hypothetical protein
MHVMANSDALFSDDPADYTKELALAYRADPQKTIPTKAEAAVILPYLRQLCQKAQTLLDSGQPGLQEEDREWLAASLEENGLLRHLKDLLNFHDDQEPDSAVDQTLAPFRAEMDGIEQHVRRLLDAANQQS